MRVRRPAKLTALAPISADRAVAGEIPMLFSAERTVARSTGIVVLAVVIVVECCALILAAVSL